jgi:hypothetical protein
LGFIRRMVGGRKQERAGERFAHGDKAPAVEDAQR